MEWLAPDVAPTPRLQWSQPQREESRMLLPPEGGAEPTYRPCTSPLAPDCGRSNSQVIESGIWHSKCQRPDITSMSEYRFYPESSQEVRSRGGATRVAWLSRGVRSTEQFCAEFGCRAHGIAFVPPDLFQIMRQQREPRYRGPLGSGLSRSLPNRPPR